MDFARKQLEKYGWTDGKGLGKYENGMSEALKPKLKRSMTGIGHDAAADFTEHWWSTLYDKAANNIVVKEKDGSTKKIKTKDNTGFEITNSTWKLKKKWKETSDEGQEQYQEFFVKTAVLGSGGSRVERVRDSESESEGDDERNVFKMTDEELFAACGGRTAHKGARHGLKALGKLARIEQQEKLLLQQSKFNGYSHAKKLKKSNEKIVEDAGLKSDEEQIERKKKKSKKKHCLRSECGEEDVNAIECENNSRIKKKKKKSKNSSNSNEVENYSGIEEENTESLSKKIKKKKSDGDTMTKNENETEKESNSVNEVLSTNLKEPKMKRNNGDLDSNICKMEVDITCNEELATKRKKKKHRE